MKWPKSIAEYRVIGKHVTKAGNIHFEFLRASSFLKAYKLALVKDSFSISLAEMKYSLKYGNLLRECNEQFTNAT